MSLNTTYTWEREDGEEVSIEIEFTCAPYYPAIVSGPPSRWCDAEGGDIETIEFTAGEGCTPEMLEEFKLAYCYSSLSDEVDEECYAVAREYSYNGPDY